MCGTRIARSSSVPSSGFLPLSTVSASSRLARGLLDPAVRRGPRRLADCTTRRNFRPAEPPFPARALGAPLQSFPFPGSRTRSRGPLLPCGFVLRPPPAQRLQDLRDRFRLSRQPFASRARPKADPGLMSRDVGSPRFASPVASTHRSVPHVPSSSHLRWARRLTAGTPASKLCSPRESVPRRPRNLARPRTPVGALLGFSPSRALSTTVPGSVSRVGTQKAFASRAPPGAQPSRLHSVTRTPTPGLACPGSVDARTL
jgi:hypothetical protein